MTNFVLRIGTNIRLSTISFNANANANADADADADLRPRRKRYSFYMLSDRRSNCDSDSYSGSKAKHDEAHSKNGRTFLCRL